MVDYLVCGSLYFRPLKSKLERLTRFSSRLIMKLLLIDSFLVGCILIMWLLDYNLWAWELIDEGHSLRDPTAV